MSLPPDAWQLMFSAGYIVPQCKEEQNKIAVSTRVKGSPIGLTSDLTDYFLPLFIESWKYPTEIVFTSKNGRQHNDVRALVRDCAFGDSTMQSTASRALAERLAIATDKRSPLGLLLVLVGKSGQSVRVAIWKFPTDESIRASFTSGDLVIEVIRNVFSKKKEFFKAAMFEGESASGTFWKGRVEDKQASDGSDETSQFWLHDFLDARTALTPTHGTKHLAKGLIATINQTPGDNKKEVLAAITIAKSLADRPTSLKTFGETYIPNTEVRQCFFASVDATLLEDVFMLDGNELKKQLKYKTLILDENFFVTGPFDEFGNRVRQNPLDNGMIQIVIEGQMTSITVGSRR